MKIFAQSLLIAVELAAVGAFVAAWWWSGTGSNYGQTAWVAGSLLAVTSAVLNYANIRGLFRRIHDALFENSPGETVRYVFLLRYPLLSLLWLASFPLIACSWGRRLLDSLFSVRPLDLAFITGLSLLNSWSIMVVVELIVMYGPHRFGGTGLRLRPAWQRALAKTRHLVFALFALPIIFTAWRRLPDPFWGTVWAVVGATVAFALLAFTAWQREQVVHARSEPSSLLLNGRWFRHGRYQDEEGDEEPEVPGFFAKILQFLGPGYYDVARQQPQPGHLLALSLLLVLLCVYVLIGFAFAPSGGWNDYFPALGYILIVMLLLSWGLPGASFFFDRWRAPVLLLLVIGTVLLYQASHTDHYYQTQPVSTTRPQQVASLAPREALDSWVQLRSSQADRMTVVALSGGGIAASAWAAEVLTGLEQEFGSAFTQSLHAISSASGGSVAAMYYLDGFRYHQPRSTGALERIRHAAAHSSLPALTWGVAYPDLWRFVLPPAMTWLPYHDRGWALQEAWRRHLLNPQMTLHSLRSAVAKGEMPVVLFDATVVDTGRQFVLTPVDIHRSGGTRFQASQSFLQHYPDQDIDLVTAARLSATFPWVSPICRAPRSTGGPDWHIADGAYFDNYGMVSLLEWLHTILPHYTRLVPNPRLLLIRVSIRPLQFVAPESGEKEGWAYTFYGPLMTLLASGASSQLARNEQLLEMFLERWADRGSVDVVVVDFPLRIEVPLSWQLSPESIGHIRSRWADERRDGGQLDRIRQFFR